mgnify:FL=1
MTFTDTFLEERDSIPIFVPDKKEKRMEIVTIEAQTFLEMNRTLEALAKKVREICGENSRSMDDWIDNQEACMLMGASPGKLLQLRRRRALPYSHIDRKVYYRRQDIIRFMENTIRQVIL